MNKDCSRFIPFLEPLEERVVPVRCIGIGSSVFCFPESPPTPPRTGGDAIQVGSELSVRSEQIALQGPLSQFSSTVVLTDGAGHVAVSWDGEPVQFFSGVSTIDLFGTAPINLDAFSALGPLPQAVQLNLIFQGGTGALFEQLSQATQLENALAAAPGSSNALALGLQPLLGAQLQLAAISLANEQAIQGNSISVPVAPF